MMIRGGFALIVGFLCAVVDVGYALDELESSATYYTVYEITVRVKQF